MEKTAITEKINQKIKDLIESDKCIQENNSLREMTLYALGFDLQGKLISGGKRLRPLFCCLTCGALYESIEPALGFAAGVEMIHNFTLIHDDIEDNSDIRHNKPTVWRKWNLPLAINAGDFLFELALYVINNSSIQIKQDGLKRTEKAVSELFLGQHLDISFESRCDVTETEYLRMIRGKTGVLFGLCFALGAISAGKDQSCVEDFNTAGLLLGRAFQIRDDYLGLWGDAAELGKSISSDVRQKKNTLAVIYTAERDAIFSERWKIYDGNEQEEGWFVQRISESGAKQYMMKMCREASEQADGILSRYVSDNEYWELLKSMISSLLERRK